MTNVHYYCPLLSTKQCPLLSPKKCPLLLAWQFSIMSTDFSLTIVHWLLFTSGQWLMSSTIVHYYNFNNIQYYLLNNVPFNPSLSSPVSQFQIPSATSYQSSSPAFIGPGRSHGWPYISEDMFKSCGNYSEKYMWLLVEFHWEGSAHSLQMFQCSQFYNG